MAGLLGDFLPWAYSRGNMLQRKLGGLLADPVGSAQQTAGMVGDNVRSQNALMDLAFQNPQRPFQVTDSGALGQATTNALAGLLGFAPAGMVVYHGSPHPFRKFNANRMGSGEGNQVYGPGTYLAENPAVSAGYMRAGRDEGFANWDNAGRLADKAYAQAKGQLSEATRLLDDAANTSSGDAFRANIDAAKQMLASGQQRASLYKVDLPDSSVPKMLDWDRPLDQQPSAIQDLVRSLSGGKLPSGMTGKDAFALIGNASRAKYRMGPFDSSLAAATSLREAGVPGLRYLDGGSRGAGAGTSNFVVFPGEEGMLNILERNGQPLR